MCYVIIVCSILYNINILYWHTYINMFGLLNNITQWTIYYLFKVKLNRLDNSIRI